MSVSPHFVYAENAVLTTAAREKLAVTTLDNPIIQMVAPIDRVDAASVNWEVKDDIRGLMEARMLNSEFPTIQRTGLKRFQMSPSYYGESIVITEDRLTLGRQAGTFGNAIDITAIQADDQDQLLNRAIDRITNVISEFARTGKYYVFLDGRSILAQQFTIQTFASTIPVSTVATATPLADIRKMQTDYGTGNSASFGASARILLNRSTMNTILSNTNAGDLGRFMTLNGTPSAFPMTDVGLNKYLSSQGLPEFVVYQGAYLDENGVAQVHIPDGKAIVIGVRPDGATPMRYTFTRNTNNMVTSGGQFNSESISDLYYSFEFKTNPVRGISTMGFNGGLVVPHPRAFISWSLY